MLALYVSANQANAETLGLFTFRFSVSCYSRPALVKEQKMLVSLQKWSYSGWISVATNMNRPRTFPVVLLKIVCFVVTKKVGKCSDNSLKLTILLPKHCWNVSQYLCKNTHFGCHKYGWKMSQHLVKNTSFVARNTVVFTTSTYL